MDHAGRPSAGRSRCAWAHGVAMMCAGVLAFGGVAVAAPKGDPGPPQQAQGNGPPATPPGQAKKQEEPAATAQPGGEGQGKSMGGHAKARGNGHTGGSSSSTAPSVNSQEGSGNGHAGKTT